MNDIDADFYKIIEKRVWDSQVCTSKNCKLVFQGTVIPKLNFKQYCHKYLSTTESLTYYEIDGIEIGIAPSHDGFKHISFMNGLCTTLGGTHVDMIVNNICRDSKVFVLENSIAVLAEEALTSGGASTIPKAFFWFGHIINQTL